MYLVQYDELVLKGKNRRDFEDQLLSNISTKLRLEKKLSVRREFGMCLVDISISSDANLVFSTTPGIKYSAPVALLPLDIDTVGQYVCEIFPKSTKDFKVRTTRSYKGFHLQSMDINQYVGSLLVEKFGTKVNLENPSCTVHIHVAKSNIYVSMNRMIGLGGLPVGSSGTVVSLLSGGIDSPVASVMMMQRGCEVVLFHAYNRTLRPKALEDKILQLAKKLATVQGNISLYMIPYISIQQEIVGHIPEAYRMIAFKRSIMRVGSLLAQKVGALALITGDSVGQVASQTLENIQSIYAASSFPVLSPLIGSDKQSIIQRARTLGTFDISTLPYDDCCSLIAAKHPCTKCFLSDIESMEQRTGLCTIEKELVADIQPQHISYQ